MNTTCQKCGKRHWEGARCPYCAMKPSIKETEMTRTGTNYFHKVSSAIAYYRTQGDEDASDTVRKALAEGRIHIGRPKVADGQVTVLDTVEGRYYLEDQA